MLKIAIPYRGREEHLERFSREGIKFFEQCGQPFKIIIVEQSEGGLFNLAKLTNIGFDLFNKEGFSQEDSYIFQPVDCIPSSVDYTAPRGSLVKLMRPYEHKFYKAFSVDPRIYEKINGMTNQCWGWGSEDDDLFTRLAAENISVEARAMIMEELFHDHLTDVSNQWTYPAGWYKEDGLSSLEYSVVEETKKYGITTFICKI